jgi:hypothetical protein
MNFQAMWRAAGPAALCLAGATLLSSQAPAPAARFTCPATMTVNETPSVPPSNQAAWQAEAKKSEHKFQHPNIYNGTPGKEEYDLAPDHEQSQGKQIHQSWEVVNYRTMNVFVRCGYAGTPATLVANLPPAFKICNLTFVDSVGNQPITAPSFECH